MPDDTIPESEPEPEPEPGRRTDGLQILAAILLGVAATLTAVAVFNSSLRDGESLRAYTASTRELSDANFYWSKANQTYFADFALFLEFAKAANAGDDELSAYVFGLMRPELQEAVGWWSTADDDVIDPFDVEAGSPYVIEDEQIAEATEQRAAALFDEAAEANRVGDRFSLATVFFALALFFGGIATLFERRSVTVGLLAGAVITLAIGSGVLIAAF